MNYTKVTLQRFIDLHTVLDKIIELNVYEHISLTLILGFIDSMTSHMANLNE